MKSFTRIKKIHGLDYLYEITPYYDPETKKIKQRSRYLGKNVNGTAIKVFSQGVPPKKILSYGEFMLLNKIVEDLNLEQILYGLLSEKENLVNSYHSIQSPGSSSCDGSNPELV